VLPLKESLLKWHKAADAAVPESAGARRVFTGLRQPSLLIKLTCNGTTPYQMPSSKWTRNFHKPFQRLDLQSDALPGVERRWNGKFHYHFCAISVFEFSFSIIQRRTKTKKIEIKRESVTTKRKNLSRRGRSNLIFTLFF
jgi:hypothetical protein